MKAVVAGILTALLLAAMLVIGSRDVAKAPSTEPVENPGNPAEEAVRALIRSGDRGDVTGYLEAFTGPWKDRITREVAERGREAFADDLRRAALSRKGHAVYAAEPDGADAARVAVETVYPDRNERRTYRVVNSADGWRVAEVATARTRQPAARFGAAVSPTTPDESTPKVGLTVEADP